MCIVPKNISVSNNLKVSRKEYVTWKYAISNLYSFSYIHYLLYGKKNTRKTKPNLVKLPLETGAVPSLFWIAVTLGGQDRFCWGLPTKGVEEKHKTAVVRPMACRRNKHMVSSNRKIYGLDKDLMVHCPSMQRFGCNF